MTSVAAAPAGRDNVVRARPGWRPVQYLALAGGLWSCWSRRTLTSVLPTIAYMNGALILFILCQIVPGMHAAPYPKEYPAHLVNGLCDAGPFHDTRYGLCPGSPGFRIPLPGSLPPAGGSRDGAS